MAPCALAAHGVGALVDAEVLTSGQSVMQIYSKEMELVLTRVFKRNMGFSGVFLLPTPQKNLKPDSVLIRPFFA